MTHTHSARNSRSGFTIAEVMMAMFILVVGLGVWLLAEKGKWSVLTRGSNYREALLKIDQKVENKRISVLGGNVPAPPQGTAWTTQDGITMKDSTTTITDPIGSVDTTVWMYRVWATWPGGTDTIKIQTTVARKF